MAIPNSLFQSKGGVALMRYDGSLSEWFFVAWASKGCVVDIVTAGRTYSYALWLVCGYAAPGVTSLTVTGTSKLAIMQVAK